jgi:hypothetical protein
MTNANFFHKSKNALILAVAIGFITLANNSNAAALPELGNWTATLVARDLDGNVSNGPEAYFDTVLNITWLADAKSGLLNQALFYGDGLNPWQAAKDYASTINIGGITGWRLPKLFGAESLACQYSNLNTSCGFNSINSSEIARLYYNTLGNKSPMSTDGVYQSEYGLTNTGPFKNLTQFDTYWFSTRDIYIPTYAFYFMMSTGSQQLYDMGNPKYTWAVHDGDVGTAIMSSVPEAESRSLALVGLLLVMLLSRLYMNKSSHTPRIPTFE